MSKTVWVHNFFKNGITLNNINVLVDFEEYLQYIKWTYLINYYY